MIVTETNLGFKIEAGKYVALFGGKKANLANLQASFENFEFIRIKQTHSDISILSNDSKQDYKIEADGHFTQKTNTALVVSTGDCIPVLMYDPATEYIAAIHSGWRGVANRIVPKTLLTLQRLGCELKNMRILIGPHIQLNSFEVSNDVRDEILHSIQHPVTQSADLYQRTASNEKSFVDLNQVMKTQLQMAGIQFDHVFSLHLDTVTDLRFHSYRRDKQQSGR
ncbi:MAG: polyphenol oxidase family protein, partial [Bdellovibrionaceae bacterium]|nr:polyphenol oxidase family protein [Pseudobdellovibrionaceae bacterium]